MLLVHPSGDGSEATNDELHISIDKPTPDFAGLAKAAAGGDVFTARVEQADELEGLLQEALIEVQAGRSAVLDCAVVNGC